MTRHGDFAEGMHDGDPTDRRIAERTRFNDFDDAAHPCNKWWDEHGQYMMSGGGRRSYIWACRGWIAREQLMEGVEVTGDSLHETPPAAAPTPVQPAEGRMPSCHACGTIMEGVCPKCGTTTCVAAASVPVTEQEAREWRTERCHLEVISRVGTTMFAISAEQLDGLLAAFANRTSPAREGK